MRAVLERIECNWWNMHIRILDESDLLRMALPKIKSLWDRREEAAPYLVLSIIGFPIGVLVGWLAVILG
jgi:hypothetical protein